MSMSPVDRAKRVARRGLSFKIVADSGAFPPPNVLNAFLGCGVDDRADERLLWWVPFVLTAEQHRELLEWWKLDHPEARVRRFSVRDADFSRWFTRAVDSRGGA
jgi:hypothetical protein